jgi:predicted dehydrogenase
VTPYLDFRQHVAGLGPSRLVATSSGSLGAEIEEAIAITVDFEGGAIGSLLASASTRGSPATRFEIWGDHGTLRLEPAPSIYTERAINGLVPGRWYALPEAAMVDPRTRFVERFSTAVLEGRPPDVSATDGLAVQTLVEAAYRSAASQEWVSMTEEAR